MFIDIFLIRLLICLLIFLLQENSSKTVFKVKVSFIEIYKEEARDLLEFEGARKDLHIREDDKGTTGI